MSSKKRILFVDDEPDLLNALEGLLRSRRHEWEMRFEAGGEAAIAALAETDFDILVTDMRMPGIDGAALLRHARAHHPGTVRFALSGHTEFETMLRLVPLAHQFLHKPCDPVTLQAALDSACAVRDLLLDPTLRAMMGGEETFRTPPQLYSTLLVALEDPRTTTADIALIIEQDIGLCSQILRVVNSAFFAPSQRIGRIDQAVRFLGVSTVKWLALSLETYGSVGGSAFTEAVREEATQHALLAARIAQDLAGQWAEPADAVVACMLGDIGRCVLAAHFEAESRSALDEARANHRSLHDVEFERLGVTHAEISAYLLGAWGLPLPLTQAVALHHSPARARREAFDLVGVVHVADALAAEALDPGASLASIDLGYLERTGVADRLDEWRGLARARAEDAGGFP